MDKNKRKGDEERESGDETGPKIKEGKVIMSTPRFALLL